MSVIWHISPSMLNRIVLFLLKCLWFGPLHRICRIILFLLKSTSYLWYCPSHSVSRIISFLLKVCYVIGPSHSVLQNYFVPAKKHVMLKMHISQCMMYFLAHVLSLLISSKLWHVQSALTKATYLLDWNYKAIQYLDKSHIFSYNIFGNNEILT